MLIEFAALVRSFVKIKAIRKETDLWSTGIWEDSKDLENFNPQIP